MKLCHPRYDQRLSTSWLAGDRLASLGLLGQGIWKQLQQLDPLPSDCKLLSFLKLVAHGLSHQNLGRLHGRAEQAWVPGRGSRLESVPKPYALVLCWQFESAYYLSTTVKALIDVEVTIEVEHFYSLSGLSKWASALYLKSRGPGHTTL